MTNGRLTLRSVSKRFERRGAPYLALDDVSLDVAAGEFVCLLGPSGSGKTTLLHILAGLETASAGEIVLDGRPVSGPGRERGVVFQQYALFPWLTVRQNIEFALSLRGVAKKNRRLLAVDYLAPLGMAEFGDLWPRQLSGGMKQRVAIARAYAAEPRVLLMDEPFGALDAQTKMQVQQDLLTSWERTMSTIVFVTHDVEEAVFLGQRVVTLTSAPGRVATAIPVEFAAPRNEELRFTPEFAASKDRVWHSLKRVRDEVAPL